MFRADSCRSTAKTDLAAAEAEDNRVTKGAVLEYMGDIVAVAGDGARALQFYEEALAERQRSDLNDANKAQAERAYLFKSAIAAARPTGGIASGPTA